MIEVIRHTTDLKQFASSLYMDSSIILPDALYATTANVPRPNTIHEDIKNTGALFQIPFKCDPGMADMKTEGKRFIKKQKHGRREKIPEGTLCVVCSDLASGIHYSVASCNGCKTFFRRALVNKQAFQCQFSDDCIVDKSVRCGCRSCRLKKCFEMGMDPNAIQHDRDKIRYTKRLKKMKNEKQPCDSRDILNGKPMREEGENSPQSSLSIDDAIASPSSSFAGHTLGPSSNGSYLDHDIQDVLTEMSSLLSDLLSLEHKLDGVRYSNKFPPHTSAASCMYDRRLLDDEAWLSAYTVPVEPITTPMPCDRGNMRAWFVKDLTLMIEWAKCIPQMRQLLLNDKLALIKAFAPVYPLIQLAYFSCKYEKNQSLSNSLGNLLTTSPMSSTRLSIERNGTVDEIVKIERLWKKILPINALLIDGVCQQILRLKLSESHMVLYKIMLFFNPDADGLSVRGRATVGMERTKLLNYLYAQITRDRTGRQATELYSNMLMMTSTLIRVASYLKRTFDISHIFGPADDLIDQLIIVGL
ncbi:member nhr-40 family protein, nuclear hormone receptor family [Onchocerca flexuosa]|uniref:Member nhr-40 family protein, nuclear hormone receptor family n=1 Tax=Onchocerca flexuosa TaxID=387005 RepID=A0A238BZR3_9BILA|nr:member nhr-40 family protein, nuclear hormone receptor family [Onchocerca flexuosa]